MDQRIIDKKLQILDGLIYRSETALAGWQVRTADHLAPGKYRYDGGWTRLNLPARFPAGKTVFLKTRIEIPTALPLAATYLQFDFQELEGLLSVDGVPYAGVDHWHQRVPVARHGKLDLNAEFMSLPRIFCDPAQASQTSGFAGARLGVVSREIEGFCCEVRFASQTAHVSTVPRRRTLLNAAVSADPAPSAAPLHVGSKTLVNRCFRIHLNATGGITRLYDKLQAREVLAPKTVGNNLQLLQDGPEHEDAWNIHETSNRRRYPFEGPSSVRVVETGPVRGVVRVTRQHRQSVLSRTSSSTPTWGALISSPT